MLEKTLIICYNEAWRYKKRKERNGAGDKYIKSTESTENNSS